MADTEYRGYLITINGYGENGSRFPIAVDSCYIGANAKCEVRLLDVDCNDRHCLIKFIRNKATIYCLCNERPVLLNDEPIDENGRPLKNGDVIQIVDVKFKWEENDSFVDTNLGWYSMNVDNSSAEEFECNRFSEPTQIMDRKNLFEDKQEDEPHLDCNNINANEEKDETKVTATTPLVKSSVSSLSVKTTISSCGNNRSNYNHGSHNQSENNSSQDTSQIRRSRQFGHTYKTKSITNTPDEKKTASSVKRFFKNTPLQENNRAREVKTRFLMNRNSSVKATRPSFVETSERNSVVPKGNDDSNHVVGVDNLNKEEEKIVPRDDEVIELKENTFGNETNAEDATFETTVPSDMVDAPSGLASLATPKCFTNAFHSTPKAPDSNKSELASNSEADETTNTSDAVCGPDEPTRICNLDSNSILASPVKSACESDLFCRKKVESDNSRAEADSPSDTRRHHTRSTSNILKKTFEERGEDASVGEKSLTTPEKSQNECGSRSANPSLVDETELDSYSPEKKIDSRNGVSASIRSPMLESISELSAENGDAVSSEARDKSQKHDDSSLMAKCSRNLSSFSPPENNRSQEYMDSVVSTPKKPSLVDESLSATVTTPAKESAVDGVASVSTPTPSSPARHRRSTGIVPFVGTPSDVYRTTKGGFTPAYLSRFNRTSMEVEVSVDSRDSLGSIASKVAPKRSSSERKSTPLKSDRSLARDSLQLHSPIVEEYDLENEESQRESPNNDSQFQFVSKRRRRLAKSSFAIEDRILEESEVISSDLSSEQNETIDEESLEPMESFDDNSKFASTRIVVDRSAGNDTQNGLDTTYSIDSMEETVDGSQLELKTPAVKPVLPKSILTPGPRHTVTVVREKSAKKVTFCNLKEDSRTDVSVDSMSDGDSDDELHPSSRVDSSADVSSMYKENTSSLKNDSDDARLYVSDKSSDAYSFNSSAENSDSIVQMILAKRNKSVKRLSSASKSESPRLSGVRKLMNPPVSPKCDYTNVSGVKQLMKTPESLMKSAQKPSLKSPNAKSTKTPVPSQESEKTPESRTKSSKAIANCQKTPASFGKRAKTSDALAECLSAPKALMVLAKPPEIVVEFVETPKKADISVALPEGGEKTPAARKKSHSGNGDSTFVTPTTRRCSKHFRIHRSSLCMLASSLNSTLNETLSPHDCSASLENSIVEQNAEHVENEMPPPQNPQEAFKVVLVELREKLQMLQQKQDQADKEVLENSINAIDEVLVEPVPDSETVVAEKNLQNVLLDLKKRYSDVEKSNENESVTRSEIRQSAVFEVDINEPRIPSQSNINDEMVVIAAGEASRASFIDEEISDASQSGTVTAETTEFETVANNNSVVKKSEEIQSSVSDSFEQILSSVCNETKIDKVGENLSVSTAEQTPSNISVTLHSDQDVSRMDNLVETVSNDVDAENSEGTETSTDVTSSIEVNSQQSLCTESEDISATDKLSKSVDAYYSIVEFEDKQFALVQETTVEVVNEEPQVDASISMPDETHLLQNSSRISHIADGKEQPKPDTSVSEMGVRQLPQHIDTEEQETNSENLELFVIENEELTSLEPKLIVEEKSNSEESISNVTEATSETVENTTDSLTKSSLPEDCVVMELNKSTIPANDSTAEKVQRKSCQDNSTVANDTFKTCSPIPNLTVTAAEVEENEKKQKIPDTIVAHDRSKRFLDVSAHLLVHEENKENLLSLTPVAASGKEKSILQDADKTPVPSAAVEYDVNESLFLTLVGDTPNVAKRLDSSVFAGSDIEEKIGAGDKNVITAAESSNAKDASVSLNCSYPTNPELDTTREENLSCVEPSETETVLQAETSANVTEESRMPVTSCATDDGRTTDVSSETSNSSQALTSPCDTASSEVCSTALPSEVSSSVSDDAEVAPVVAPPDLNAELMTTPRRCTAVCISIECQDQLTLAGPRIVTQTVRNSAKSISTSTPLPSHVAQQTMEIPQSCSTTIDQAPSEDEAAELSSETVVDDERATVDSSARSDESQSKGETILKKTQNELVFDTSAESRPTETSGDETLAQESQNDSAMVSQKMVSAVSKESAPEIETDGDSEVATDITAPADVTEKVEMPVKRPSRNFSIVIQDAKDNLPSSDTSSTSPESAPKKIADKLVANNEGESTRPKRGRPTKRYTELFKSCHICLHASYTTPKSRYSVRPKSKTSTQSSKRIKSTANAATSNVMNLSVELERLEMPEAEEPTKSSQSKTVHFNMEPEVKRSTRPKDLTKSNDPTPKRRKTESKTDDSDLSPATNAVDQFRNPLSVVIRKIRSDKNSSAATKELPKRVSRSRSVAPKESVLVRPSRAASCLGRSSDREISEPKRGGKAKKVELVLSGDVSANKKSRPKDDAAEAAKPKESTKVSKSAAKNKKKTEIADSEEEKPVKRKAADAVVQNANVAGSSASGSKGKSKNDSKVVEVPVEGERKSRRKAADVGKTTKETTKSQKNASQSTDEEAVGNAKSSNEVPAKEVRSRRKAVADGQENKENSKVGKRATKGAEKDEVSETASDSNSATRATRQRKAAQPVEATEPPKQAKRVKVDSSTETATTSRATRSRKVAAETSESDGKNTKVETSRSKAVKRTAAVVLDSIDEVVSKKRKESSDPVPVARTTRQKKNEVPLVTREVRVSLKRQKVDEKSNKPSASTKTVADEKPVTSAVSKKKGDPTPTVKVRLTRAAKVKEVSPKAGSVAVAAVTTRVTRSQQVPTLPVSRRAKK